MNEPLSVRRFIRAHTRAVVRVRDATLPTRLVIDGATGRIVAPIPAPVADDDLGSLTLFIPDESETSAQVHASAVLAADPSAEAACDRWTAYHGTRPPGRVALMTPLGFRIGRFVADAEEVDLRNPLVAAEPSLVRAVNADPIALAALAARVAGAAVLDPRCVGVDDLGLDVRTRLGVLRVEHGAPVRDAGSAMASITALLSG